MTGDGVAATDRHRADAQVIWDYHQMRTPLRPCSAGIGLGSHDLGVATFAADLYHAGLFPVLVFSGGNSPTTAARFPRGEAVCFAEHATGLGVPASAVIIEPEAANTRLIGLAHHAASHRKDLTTRCAVAADITHQARVIS